MRYLPLNQTKYNFQIEDVNLPFENLNTQMNCFSLGYLKASNNNFKKYINRPFYESLYLGFVKFNYHKFNNNCLKVVFSTNLFSDPEKKIPKEIKNISEDLKNAHFLPLFNKKALIEHEFYIKDIPLDYTDYNFLSQRLFEGLIDKYDYFVEYSKNNSTPLTFSTEITRDNPISPWDMDESLIINFDFEETPDNREKCHDHLIQRTIYLSKEDAKIQKHNLLSFEKEDFKALGTTQKELERRIDNMVLEKIDDSLITIWE